MNVLIPFLDFGNFSWRHTTIMLNPLYKGLRCLQAYVDWNVLSAKLMIINTLNWVTTFTPLEIIKGGNHNLLLISIPLLLVYALISSKLIPNQSFLNIISYDDGLNLTKAKLNPFILTTLFLFFWLNFHFLFVANNNPPSSSNHLKKNKKNSLFCLLKTTTLPPLLTTFSLFSWLYFPFHVCYKQ